MSTESLPVGTVCTITIIPRRKVVKAIIRGREMNVRPDTTDANVTDRLRPYMPRACTWGFAGPKDASICIFVSVTFKRGEDCHAPWERAAKSLARLIKKHGGES